MVIIFIVFDSISSGLFVLLIRDVINESLHLNVRRLTEIYVRIRITSRKHCTIRNIVIIKDEPRQLSKTVDGNSKPAPRSVHLQRCVGVLEALQPTRGHTKIVLYPRSPSQTSLDNFLTWTFKFPLIQTNSMHFNILQTLLSYTISAC